MSLRLAHTLRVHSNIGVIDNDVIYNWKFYRQTNNGFTDGRMEEKLAAFTGIGTSFVLSFVQWKGR